MQFTAPLNVTAQSEVSRLGRRENWVKGALVLPASFDLRKPCPLLIVSVPSGGSAMAAMRGYTNVALKLGWAVLAADGPRVKTEEDSVQWGWAMLSSVLDYTTRTWPPAKQWPVACAGFSGGAKRSGTVAAALMKENWRILGIFMGGCNEDRATLGLTLYQPGDRFKQVPIFLSNGATDPIANPQHAAVVAESMRRTGFRNLRLESYDGEHRQSDEQLRLALQWFKQVAAGPDAR